MHSHERTLQVYVDLAEMYRQQRDPGLREVFLMLAADTALRAGRAGQAEELRQELLRNNPHHVLKPFPTFVEAMQHNDIENYLDDLRMKYPVEVAEDLLESIFPATLPEPAGGSPGTAPPERRSASASNTPPERESSASPVKVDESGKPLKVYREALEMDETEPPPTLPPQPRSPRPPAQPRPRPVQPRPIPAPRQAPPPRPAPPLQRPALAAPRQPVARTARGLRGPMVEQRTRASGDDDSLTAGAWVGTLLYLVMLAAAAAGVTIAFLPHDLLRR